MRKSFGAKPMMYPITYDPVHHTYRVLGEVVGKAFSDGLQLK